MMSTSMSSPYSDIDDRTLFRNFKIEANSEPITDARVTDVFNTINRVINNDICKPTAKKLTKYSVPPLRAISGRAYIVQGSNVATLVRDTKIPHPLTALWTNQRVNHIKRYSSWRMCVKKSNLPLIMEPTINKTSTTKPTTVNEEKIIGSSKISQDTTTAAAGEIQVSSKRKLSLIPQVQSNVNVSESTLLKRSQSLRKSYKISNNNKTDSSKTEICAGAKRKSLSLIDVPKIEEKLDGHAETTATTSSSTAPAVDKQISPPTTKIVKDFSNMSLNDNGVTRESETTSRAAITSPTGTTTAAQQIRPLTLTTQSSEAVTHISKGLKSPKTPNAVGNHINANSSPNQQHHQNRIISSQRKISPDSKLTPKTPPVTPDSPTTYLDDDLDSLFSCGTTTSGRSTMSCEHPYVARNGTTFSGRKMKYVVHCSNYAGQVGADYLTPTQRAQRQLRRLKDLLCAARNDLEQKDSEILRLTREVVELRLFKASLSSPEERSASSDAVTVREAELKTSQDVSPIVDMVDDAQKTSSPRHLAPSVILHQQHLQQSSLHQQQHMMHLSSDMQSSFADSGHFEDMTSSSVHSKDSSSFTTSLHAHDRACGGDMASCTANAKAASAATVEQYEVQRQELIRLYEQRIEDLIRNQDATTSEIKRTNCDRIEALLQKLAECNTRYADIVPDYEHAKERIRELEKQLEELQRRLVEHEEKQKQMYLHMYQKGQEAERIARADQALELAHRAPQNKVSINELLHQLQSTQDELENIRAAECRKECGNNHALLTAKEAISLWVLGARKTIYRRLLEAQKNRTHVDPEVTLQFLKSAIYYFLTDKENSQGHLQAIESILEFSEAEKQTINKFRLAK